MVGFLDIDNIPIEIFRFHGITIYPDNVVGLFVDLIFRIGPDSGGYVGKLHAGSSGGDPAVVGEIAGSDLLELLLAERMSYFSKEREKEKLEDARKEQFCQWRELLTGKYPGIEKDGSNFMDWLVACQGREVVDAYRFGIKEGIRIAKWVFFT